MMYDKDRRPYVKSPLMAQYFAGHLQTHYKRVVMGYLGIIALVFLLIGGGLGGCQGTSTPSVPTGVTERIWNFLYSVPIVNHFEESFFGPNPTQRRPPSVYFDDPPDIPFPTDPPAPVEPASDSGDSDFYTCTPGTKWCP